MGLIDDTPASEEMKNTPDQNPHSESGSESDKWERSKVHREAGLMRLISLIRFVGLIG